MIQKVELPPSIIKHIPWEGNSDPIWPASIFILSRNLSRYPFPTKMDLSQFEAVLNILRQALFNSEQISNPLFFEACDLSPLDKEFLFEHFLCLEGFQNTLKGQAFITNPLGLFLAMLNIKDHLQLQIIDSKNAWETTWNQLSILDSKLNAQIGYAYSSRFGFLTSNLFECGTGLKIKVYLHLPALIHLKQLDEALLKQKDQGIDALSLEGNVQEFIADLVILSNRYTIGLSEENILHSLHTTLTKFMLLERTLRVHLKEENNGEMKDKISRAYGLLTHSYQLQTKECLNNLSLLKLGIDLGWIEGISDTKINELFFKCRRAHLAHLFEEKTFDTEILPKKRAEFLHEQLQTTQLKI